MCTRHTFELLESKACNATYFLSLLESKGEDYLIWAYVSVVPQLFFSFSQLKINKNIFLNISEKIDKNILGQNFFDPKLTLAKLFQTERTR